MITLIPSRGMSLEERAKRNVIIRRELPQLSNKTIFLLALAKGHQLSRNELIKRLDNHQFDNLMELFELSDLLFSLTVTRIIGRLIDKAFAEIGKVALLTAQEEVIEVIKIFHRERVAGDSCILEDIICSRPDASEILKKIKEMGLNTHLMMNYIKEKIGG